MELGKHLSKGIWGLADKALPVVYGVAYVVLVIRVLPEEEFGNFVLIQEIFLIVTGLAMAFALQPLLKFAAEENADQKSILSAALLLNIVFILAFSLVIVVVADPFSELLRSPKLAPLMLYLPVMFAASFVRNFTLVLLQSRFLIKQVFWVDFIHFIGAPALIYAYSKMNLFDTALDLIMINILSLSASSLLGLWVSRSLIRLQWRPGKEELVKVWDYGKYTLGGLISYMVYTKADSFILSAFGGPVQVAVYNSVKIFTRIFDMVAQVLQMFVLPATSLLASKGETKSLKAFVEKALNFSTVGMVPVFVLFLFFAPLLVGIVYQGRYAEAVPMLQIFAVLSFIIPASAVGSNTLLGLGHARLGFYIGLALLVASVVIYMVFIPWLGPLGATIGYVLSTLVLAWMTIVQMNKFVPVTLREVGGRTRDIKAFIRTKLNV
ncbi:MAG: oligosaccharide flippase family protein [Bacteroidetes bacterium]|nr:oligosaccharide flippase family protein [Bacteroidota bacterium]MCW5895856.1 oligosaccharide flippase family protein [Bacteroidota bacterium]